MFESWGLRVENVPDGFFQPYDIKTIGPEGKEHTYEVKYDILAEKTGRFFLEDEALPHSHAEWLAIVTTSHTIYFIPLSEAKKIASQSKKVRGGEYGGWGAIPPKSAIEQNEYCQILRANP